MQDGRGPTSERDGAGATAVPVLFREATKRYAGAETDAVSVLELEDVLRDALSDPLEAEALYAPARFAAVPAG